MWEFLIGLVAGAGIVLAKDYFVGRSEKRRRKLELDMLSDEAKTYRNRAQEAERRIDDLHAEITELTKQVRNSDDHQDNLQDDLDDARRQNKKLTLQVADLTAQLAEYKSACKALELEISQLKQK